MSQQPLSMTTSDPPASLSTPAYTPVTGLGMAPTSFPESTFGSTPMSSIGGGMGSSTMQTNLSSSPFQPFGGQQPQGVQQSLGGLLSGQPFWGQKPLGVQQSLGGQPFGGQQPLGGQNSLVQSIATGPATPFTSSYQPMSLPQPVHANSQSENRQLAHQPVSAALTRPDSTGSGHQLSSSPFKQHNGMQGMFNQDSQRGSLSFGLSAVSSVNFGSTNVFGSLSAIPKTAEVSRIVDKSAAVQKSAEVRANIKVEKEATDPFQSFPKNDAKDDDSAIRRRSRRSRGSRGRRLTAKRQPVQQPVQKPTKAEKQQTKLRKLLSSMNVNVLDNFLASNTSVRMKLEERLEVFQAKTQGQLRGGFADTMERRFEDLRRELREEFRTQQVPTAMPTAITTTSIHEGRRLYIGNLSYATTKGDITSFFNGFSVVSIEIPTNPRTQRSVGYAFVDISTSEEAKRATVELSGKEMDDRKVSVQIARQPQASQATKSTRRNTIVSESSAGSGSSSSSNWLEEAMQDPSLRPRWSAEQLAKLNKPSELMNDNGKRLLDDHIDEPQARRARTSSPVKTESRMNLGSVNEPHSLNASPRKTRSPSIHPDRLHLQEMEKSFSTLVQYDTVNLPPVALQPSVFSHARSYPKGSSEYIALVSMAIEIEIRKPAVKERIMSIWSGGAKKEIQEEVLICQIAEKYISTASTMGVDYLEDVFANTEEGTRRFKYETKQYLMALGYRGFNF